MSEVTTIRVSKATRDEIRALAEADGVTLDAKIHQLARRERQRRMGEAAAARPLSEQDEAWIAGGSRTAAAHVRR